MLTTEVSRRKPSAATHRCCQVHKLLLQFIFSKHLLDTSNKKTPRVNGEYKVGGEGLRGKMNREGRCLRLDWKPEKWKCGMRFPHPHCREGKHPCVGKLLLNGNVPGQSIDLLSPVSLSSFMANSRPWPLLESNLWDPCWSAGLKGEWGRTPPPRDDHWNYTFEDFGFF